MTVCNHSASERLLDVVEFCPIPNACMPRCICVGGAGVSQLDKRHRHMTIWQRKKWTYWQLLSCWTCLRMKFKQQKMHDAFAFCTVVLENANERVRRGMIYHDMRVQQDDPSASCGLSLLPCMYAHILSCQQTDTHTHHTRIITQTAQIHEHAPHTLCIQGVSCLWTSAGRIKKKNCVWRASDYCLQNFAELLGHVLRF